MKLSPPLLSLRFVYGCDLAGPPPRTFDEVLAAVGSNRLDAEQRPALVVVERGASEDARDDKDEDDDDYEDEDECELDMETMQPLDPSKCLQ